ncbi:MAG: WecB/TagA/CpsF family glycosyltransferase [Xenococcus sp. MO_188.B8]|nr:WecB/TagA/CpsF family glycosyltransferase [Xenococcus sp. MO_188.B8]
MNRKKILNGSFDSITTAETSDWATQLIKLGERGYICTVNVAILMMMSADSQLQRFVERASLVVADGQPIVWASRLLSQALPERVTGIDLIDSLAVRAEKEQFRIYLLGATQEVITTAAANLKSRYPKLDICGFDDGYFSASETSERVQAIRQSGAQILIVGMGVPRQEVFLEENWSDLGVNLAIGVGGSFDVIAGKKKRAPSWMQTAGLEWLYRLIQEPQRLWKRYLVTNLQFIYRLLSSSIAGWRKSMAVR